ncbi:Endo-1,4-beta-xylanase precursor, putative [Ricinus communis]|uniref:Endo-1,4-beta-xylanase, putative n=2 Tax=Ricinus communis TaxID=3988 RepID=B9T2E8_RICCO|nr:Endo-1,4-beta-xylanase precursor, putative [Ricinus communis]
MKWYSTEQTYGNVDYSIPDAMIQFAKQNNISVRGHNVFWDDPKYQPGWLNSLSPSDFKRASMRRLKSIMLRYKGKVIAWDVVNENMHFSFFESKLGQNASAVLYKMAQKVDGNATLFLNEFNTIEDSRDDASSRTKYLKTLKEIKGYPGNENLKLGIGLESHFNTPNLPYMRASIDILAAANLPIWLTEVDVESSPNQAQYLEEVLREAHGHPKVTGIILWSAWKPEGCYRMCLTDHNFKNLPTGDVVDKLMGEWFGIESSSGMADANGFFEISLSHGEYLVKIHHQASNSSFDQMIVLASSDDKKLPCDNASSSFNM